MGSASRQRRLGKLFVNGSQLLLIIIWTVPTMGIFVSSFRHRDDIANTGWWKVLPHREWQPVEVIDPRERGLDPDSVMEIEGASGTFEEFRAGVQTPDGKQITWIGNKRIGRVEVQERVWAVSWDFSLDNYRQVLGGQSFEFTRPDGTALIAATLNSGIFAEGSRAGLVTTLTGDSFQ